MLNPEAQGDAGLSSTQQTSRNLFVGLLGLQCNLLTREELVSAFSVWVLNKRRNLADILVEQRALDAGSRQLLEALVRKQLERSEGNLEQSLAGLTSVASMRQSLAELGDTDVNATLPPLSTAPVTDDPYATLIGPGVPTSTGTRFRILRPHAKGGLGQVSVALDAELHREVALKEIQPRHADDAVSRERFVVEAEITGGLEHPGIVPVYALGQYPDGRPFYAMRFIRGDSLKEALDAFHAPGKPTRADPGARLVELRNLLRRFIDVCNAMEYAHSRGVLHRDLKPGNVMVGRYGETLVVDWGLAKSVERSDITSDEGALQPASPLSSSGQTQPGSALGTPAYMSPEQAAGRLSELGPATDIYSLGATLYHLLTGSPPCEGDSLAEQLQNVQRGRFRRPREVRPEIPRPLEAICLKAMALNPEDRYRSPRELATDIELWMADEPVHACPDTFSERAFRWFRRHRAWTQGVATMLPLLLLVAIAAAIVVERARQKEVTARADAENQRDRSNKAQEEEARQRKLADESRQTAIQEEQKALHSAGEARKSLANLLLANGQRLQDEGDLSGAALWFSRVLPLLAEQGESIETPHRIRLNLLLQKLPRPSHVWTLPPDQRRFVIHQQVSLDGRLALLYGAAKSVRGVNVETGKELWPPLEHDALVSAVGFSLDSRRIATASQDQRIRVWDAESGKPLTPPLATEQDLPWNASGPGGHPQLGGDGTTLAIATAGQIEVWNVATGERRFPPRKFSGTCSALRVSPDGKQLFLGTADAGQFLDAATGESIGAEIPNPGAWSARYSPDGRWLAATSGEGRALLCDTTTAAVVTTLNSHLGVCLAAVFSPDSKSLITLHSNRAARIWEVPSGQALEPVLDHGERPMSAAFSTDGRQVLTIALDNTVRIWDRHTARLIAGPIWQTGYPDATLRDDGVWIIANGRGTHWDTSRQLEPGAVRIATPVEADLLEFSDRHPALAIAAADRVWLIDAGTGEQIAGPMSLGGKVKAMAIDPGGTWFAAGGDNGSVRLWKTKDGRPHGEPLNLGQPVTHLRFSPQGDRLLTCSGNVARIWNVSTGTLVGPVLEHPAPVRDGDFSSEGQLVATGGDDRAFRIWNARTAAPQSDPIPLQPEAGDPVTQVRFHPARPVLAVSGASGTVVLREPLRGDATSRTLHAAGAVQVLRYSPDGRRLLAAGMFHNVHVWDVEHVDQPPVRVPSGFMSLQARFHPGSYALATASFGGVRMFEAADGRPMGPLFWNGPMSARALKSIAFSGDGHWLASIDTHVRLWDVTADRRSPEAIDQLVRLLAGRELDERDAIQFLSHEQLDAAFESVSRRSPKDLRPQPGVTITLP